MDNFGTWNWSEILREEFALWGVSWERLRKKELVRARPYLERRFPELWSN